MSRLSQCRNSNQAQKRQSAKKALDHGEIISSVQPASQVAALKERHRDSPQRHRDFAEDTEKTNSVKT